MRLETVAVELLERGAGALMQAHPLRRCQLVVEHVPNQDVGEAKAAGGARNLCHHAFGDSFVDCVEQLVTGQLAHVIQCVDGEVAAEHGREHECPVAGLGQAANAAADRLLHARWNAERSVHVAEASLCSEQPDDLEDEERIALGLCLDLGHG